MTPLAPPQKPPPNRVEPRPAISARSTSVAHADAAPSRPLRVLVVARRAPWPLNHGGKLRLYHLLRWLSRDASVTLACPPDAAARLPHRVRRVDLAPADATTSTNQIARGFIARRLRQHFGYDPRLAGWLRANATRENFDVALLSGALAGLHAPDVQLPTAWDLVDASILAALRSLQFGGLRRWPRNLVSVLGAALIERHVLHTVNAVTVISRDDARWVPAWLTRGRVSVIPNGVSGQHRTTAAEVVAGRLLFVGAFDFPPNIDAANWFARRVWPGIHALDPRRSLRLVGRSMPASIRALGELPGVDIAGEVPDVALEYAAAAVVVIPTRGRGGLKNKLLEACALARPVVASAAAAEASAFVAGKDLLIARRPAEWVAACDRLLSEPALAEALAKCACRRVRAVYRWPDAARQLHALLARLATRHHALLPAAHASVNDTEFR